MKPTRTGLLFLVLLAGGIAPARAERCGDCNGDGRIDSVDALVTAQHGVGLVYSYFALRWCDIDASGTLSAVDALVIAQRAVGLVSAPTCRDDFPAWEQLSLANLPPPREAAGVAYDRERRTVVFFSGKTPFESNDTWEWAIGGAGFALATPSSRPPAREGAPLVYDSRRGVEVMFGGWRHAPVYFDDTWEWDGADWTQASAAVRPSARFFHRCAYDESRGVTVLHGGQDGADVTLADTWEWDGTAWIERFSAVSPGPRMHASLIYDPLRRRVLLFGGNTGPPRWSTLGDFWEWDGDEWREILTEHRPPPRLLAQPAFDTARGLLVLYGGVNPSLSDLRYNEVWVFDGQDWVNATPTSMQPYRERAGLVYVEALDRTVLIGGYDPERGLVQDVWALPSIGPAVHRR